MISTVRVTKNDDLEECDSILEIGHCLGQMGLSEDFSIRVSNCHSDGKRHNTS